MTDSYFALTVILEKDYKDYDCEMLINAIKMIKGVLEVKPHVADPMKITVEQRVRLEIRQKLFKVLQE